MSFLSRCFYRIELLLSAEAREQDRELRVEFAKLDAWPAKIAELHRRTEEIEPGFWQRMEAQKRITHPWLFDNEP